MAFLFTREQTLGGQKKAQRLLIAVLVGVLFITSAVIWFGFFSKSSPSVLNIVAPVASPAAETKINFGVLQNKIFDALETPSSPIVIPTITGRANPFSSF